jgi:transcriptional regulator with XRE-family HTH domain
MSRMDALKDALRLLRESRGMTQRRIADALGVTPSVVSAWETGSRQPSIRRLGQIADLMGLDLGDLDDALVLAGAIPVHRRPRAVTDAAVDPRRIAQALVGRGGDEPVSQEEQRIALLLEQVVYLARRREAEARD